MSYAPAVSSCERINGVDACTVVASDAIRAFAVPTPAWPMLLGPTLLASTHRYVRTSVDGSQCRVLVHF